MPNAVLLPAAPGPAPAPAVMFMPGQSGWATTAPPEIPPLRPPLPEVFDVPDMPIGWELMKEDGAAVGKKVQLYDMPAGETVLDGQSAVFVEHVVQTGQWIIRLSSGYLKAINPSCQCMLVPKADDPKAADPNDMSVFTRYTPNVGTTISPGTSGDDLSNPLGASLGDVLLPSPEKPKAVEPTLVFDKVPGSPPSSPGVSPTDPAEAVASVLGAGPDFFAGHSDALDYSSVPVQAGGVKSVNAVGDSCEESCMTCKLAALGQEWGNMCPCYANCERGPNSEICKYRVPNGWSNQYSSVPTEKWRSKCQADTGRWRNCAACVPLKFQAAVQRCKTEPNVAACAANVRKLMVSSASGPLVEPPENSANFAGANFFCTRPNMDSCEGFAVLPANGQGGFASNPADEEWQCFGSPGECTEQIKLLGLGDRWKYSKNSTVVWDQVGPPRVGL